MYSDDLVDFDSYVADFADFSQNNGEFVDWLSKQFPDYEEESHSAEKVYSSSHGSSSSSSSSTTSTTSTGSASTTTTQHNYLSIAKLREDTSVQFHSSMIFFGCYWRNSIKNICAFPTAPEGQDYITWLSNMRQKLKSPPGSAPLLSEEGSSKFKLQSPPNKGKEYRNSLVRMSVQFPKSSNITSVVLVACLHPLSTLPDTDEYLMGKTMSKASVATHIGAEANVIEVPKEQWKTNDFDAADGGASADDHDAPPCWNAEGVFAPRAWKMKEKLKSAKAAKKLAMLHTPVTSLENSILSKYFLVTLRVLLLTTTEKINNSSSASSSASSAAAASAESSLYTFSDHHEYTVVSAVRSPGFTLGSTRSLRTRSVRADTSSSPSVSSADLQLNSSSSDEMSRDFSKPSKKRRIVDCSTVPPVNMETDTNVEEEELIQQEDQEQVAELPVERMLGLIKSHRKRDYDDMLKSSVETNNKEEEIVEKTGKTKDDVSLDENMFMEEKKEPSSIVPDRYQLMENPTAVSSSSAVSNNCVVVPTCWSELNCIVVGISAVFQLWFLVTSHYHSTNIIEKIFYPSVPNVGLQIRTLAAVVIIPLDFCVTYHMLLMWCKGKNIFWMKDRVNMLNTIRRLSLLMSLCAFLGSVLFVSSIYIEVPCIQWPCYAANRTDFSCDPCTANFCPQAWGSVADVAYCKPHATKHHPVMCGYRYCHMNDDCETGGGGDESFLGFPIETNESGFRQAQFDCAGHFKVISYIFGITRVLFCLGNIHVVSKVVNSATTLNKKKSGGIETDICGVATSSLESASYLTFMFFILSFGVCGAAIYFL